MRSRRALSGLKAIGAVTIAFVMTPLVTGYARGLADIGASADGAQAPYQAGELVHALDYHTNGYTSFPGLRIEAPRTFPVCAPRAYGTTGKTMAESTNFDLQELDNLLRRRRERAEDVRAQVLLDDVSRPMVTLYTSCIRDSIFAPICASRVDRIIRHGLPRAKRSKIAAFKQIQETDDRLVCTFVAGAATLAAEASSTLNDGVAGLKIAAPRDKANE